MHLLFTHCICVFSIASAVLAFYLQFWHYTCSFSIASAVSPLHLRFQHFICGSSTTSAVLAYISSFTIAFAVSPSAVSAFYLQSQHFICSFSIASAVLALCIWIYFVLFVLYRFSGSGCNYTEIEASSCDHVPKILFLQPGAYMYRTLCQDVCWHISLFTHIGGCKWSVLNSFLMKAASARRPFNLHIMNFCKLMIDSCLHADVFKYLFLFIC